MNTKYNEIFKLKSMLEKAEIPFDFFSLGEVEELCMQDILFEHWHINYPHKGDFKISVIEGVGSYGEKDDLLELMDCTDPTIEDDYKIQGWLTAEEAFKIIKSNYEEVQNEQEKS